MKLTDINGITKEVKVGTIFTVNFATSPNVVEIVTIQEDKYYFPIAGSNSTSWRTKQNLINNFANGGYTWI